MPHRRAGRVDHGGPSPGAVGIQAAPKRLSVIVNAGGGQVAVDFDPGDFTQCENMTEKANAPVAKTFSEEIVVAQSNYPLCPGDPNTRG